jgi:hypothetical protein
MAEPRNGASRDALCVIAGIGTDTGRDGRRHVFDCGMVLPGDGGCDAAPFRECGA